MECQCWLLRLFPCGLKQGSVIIASGPHITHLNEICEIHAGNVDGGKGCGVSHGRIVGFAAY